MPTLPSIGSFDSAPSFHQRRPNHHQHHQHTILDEKSHNGGSNRDSKFKGVLDKFVGKRIEIQKKRTRIVTQYLYGSYLNRSDV